MSLSTPSDFLSIENLRFAYGTGAHQRLILDGIDMKFRPGQVVALMGGSGSGKTTILRLIGGQVRPSQGQVVFQGKVVHSLGRADLYTLRRQMGVLFQHGALFTDLSVFDNVAFAMREHTNLSESMIRDLVLMKLQAVGLRGAWKLRPSELSGGMARRVALARAIALDPPLLLYDEPFAGLDPISLGTIANLIRDLNQALGATSILVTHDVEETFAIADYVYLLANSRIVAHGTPAELRETTDPYARQFFNAERDGPVRFHYPGRALADDLGLAAR
jgi:phospholipid/cholesterol/gamma-HCH transport system ATP-binding protein